VVGRANVAHYMKSALYGRIFFGAASVLYGVVLLIWHDLGAWEGMPIPKLPFGDVIADLVAIALILGGVMMMISRTAHHGSILSGFVFIIFSIAALPPVIAHPLSYPPYIGFFEIFSLVWGAVALYAITGPVAAAATLGRVTRLLLGVCTVSFATAQMYFLKYTASLVPAWIPPGQMFWAVLTTVAFGLAAIAMLINVKARLALYLTALMIALFGILVWIPIVIAAPQKHFNWGEFAVTMLIAGASCVVADAQPSPALHGKRLP
jgi:hypothetical protein